MSMEIEKVDRDDFEVPPGEYVYRGKYKDIVDECRELGPGDTIAVNQPYDAVQANLIRCVLGRLFGYSQFAVRRLKDGRIGICRLEDKTTE